MKLSYACTIEKVQGLSLKQVVIWFDLYRQKSFMSSQMYVALSKITSLPGLFLICRNNKSVTKKIVISLFECLIIKETFLRYLKYFMFGSDWYIGF